ncbi:uncharacterized protein LOC115677187 [Syzygium oleosum]|uniref:uncharacterized protein LOC115677187 n=1 Tax=Syzygium oleosum TaxID=219896 RepID=UPI0011D243D2|nr:uncharacterized protein LOC115677187 [Syzygium oleosum]
MRPEHKHPHQPPPPPPPQQQQQWRVNLHARSGNFTVELTATTPVPTWRPRDPHRLSLLLRLWSFVLRVQSDCETELPRRRWRSLGSRFLGALERIRGFRAQKRAVATLEADKAEIGITRPYLVLVLISAFLLGAVSARRLDKIGAGAAAAASSMILARASKKLFASFAVVLLGLLSVARSSSSRALDLGKHADFAGGWAPRGILWKIWKSAAASWNS